MPGHDRIQLVAHDAVRPELQASASRVALAVGQRTRTLSAVLWGLDLTRDLPRTISADGVEAVAGDSARAHTFLAQHFPSFAEEALGALPTPNMRGAKQWYLASACDAIELRHRGRMVGLMLGAPEDWSSYYIRIFAVIPTYQRRALIRRFVRECLFEPLKRHDVERVVADASPMNIGVARRFSELHFHVTGHQLSDRWGPLVRYTKFLEPACEAAFLRRFPGIATAMTKDGE